MVIFIDLDRFKLINDSFSHDVGDKLLIAVAERLRAVTREEDIIARLSGDEFVSLSTSLKKSEDAIQIAVKILSEISKEIKLSDREITITASLGISIFPADGLTANELLRNADLAMYRSKSSGRNPFQFYKEELKVTTQHVI